MTTNAAAQSPEMAPFPLLPRMDDPTRLAVLKSFAQLMARRRSCRDFATTPIAKEVIAAALTAAGTSPSGANHQPWHFAAIGDQATKVCIRDAAEAEERAFYDGKAGDEWLRALAPLGTDADKPFLTDAPWLIVVFSQRWRDSDEAKREQNYYVTESVGIACGILLTALHQAGLATLTHTPAPMNFLRDICRRPDSEKPLMIIAAGLPAPTATVPLYGAAKKPVDQITSWI